ncbi:type II secretion system F family protein [Sphingomonas sp. MG17]|jgi:tight adherence protein B|uniref:Type II secretion system F family protein n=1 Tax=Sphingomonas tagetis TaxID=2949092 RepID=A0A9X2HKH3_9SPHN|nr:type II secretion system F family protein [Sphingomonas tagetis]MCP3729529.1 type II secretion system F family protein [Sphingomonas tagetis]
MSDTTLRALVLLLVFGAVLLAADAALQWARNARGKRRAVNKRLEMIEHGADQATIAAKLRRDSLTGPIDLPGMFSGPGKRLEKMLRTSGVPFSPMQLAAWMMMAAFGIFMVVTAGAVVGGIGITAGTLVMIAAFAGVVGIALPLFFFARQADKRHKKLLEQFPVALDIFVRGLRAGHPVAAALDLLTREMADPIGSEFGLATDEVTYGAELRDALHNMAERCDLDDMRMFVVSLAVQNETGGNLAEILDNLSRVIRERASMAMMVRALSSEGRMTAAILTALPLLAFSGLFLLNPAFYLDVADDPAFLYGFTGLIFLYIVGFVTIRRMIDLKV